jgi:hypothetical protein
MLDDFLRYTVFVYAEYFYSLRFYFYLGGGKNIPAGNGTGDLAWRVYHLAMRVPYYQYRNLLIIKMFNGALLTATSSVTDRFLWCQYKYKLV